MATEKDLFDEEQTMATMSFGEHIEELRTRLILALYGLAVGVLLTFIPPISLGWRIMTKMQEPAQAALTAFYTEQAEKRSAAAEKANAVSHSTDAIVPAEHFFAELRRIAPNLDLPDAEQLKDK